jgi:hypothetical protein
MMRALRNAVLAVALVGALGLASASAQGGPVPGEVTGTLRPLGAVPLEGVPVTLLVVRDSGIAPLETTSDAAGRFRFDVEADPSITYLASATVEGVQYWSPLPALLSPELPSAAIEVVVASTTTVAPELRVESTTVSALALDRANGQLVFAREDLLVNPTAQTYVPAEGGASVRVPVPDATLQSGGEATRDGLPAGGTVTQEGATIAASVPVRPGTTVLTTRYLVSYDAALDEYVLRFTAPLPTKSMRVEIPESFVRSTAADEGVRRTSTSVDGQSMLVFEASDLAPGRGGVVTLRGLAGVQASNPLTSTGGAAAGVAVTLALAGAGMLVGLRRRPALEAAA